MTSKPGISRDGGLRDDRGNVLAHFNFDSIRESAGDAPLLRMLLDEAAANPTRELRTLWIGIIGFCIYAGILFVIHLALFAILGWSYYAGGSWYWAIAGTFVALIIARTVNAPVDRVLRRAVADRRAGLISRTAVHAGLCGACGYPLESLEPETDGCVVCPECGAAWRVPPDTPDNGTTP
jgi:hypothetical protein